VSGTQNERLSLIQSWIDSDSNLESVVLFGSTASHDSSFDKWSDIDLHVVVRELDRFSKVDWKTIVHPDKFLLSARRAASGGVTKVTVLCCTGHIDLVLVPIDAVKAAEVALRADIKGIGAPLQEALNEMSTCLKPGYRFLKGERRWGPLYAQVANEMPGVRLDDESVRLLASTFVCDTVWILQKIRRGELIASQLLLHTSLSSINLRFLRELRIRVNAPLPSFGLGRRIELLLSESELREVSVNAHLDGGELVNATMALFEGFKNLMNRLIPDWNLAPNVDDLVYSLGNPRSGYAIE
jgi:hypothetical protein